MVKRLAHLLLLLAAALTFASAQTPADTLRTASKRIGVADLPKNFRAVSFGPDGISNLGVLGMMGDRYSTSDDPSFLFFNLMGAVYVDPDQFGELLDGKTPRIRGYALDFTTMMKEQHPGDGANTPTPVFMETWIEGGRITQWSPRPGLSVEAVIAAFSPETNPANLRTKAIGNAKMVATAIAIYAADCDDCFPYGASTAQAQEAVRPYYKNEKVWSSGNPEGGRLLYNTALSHLTSATLEAPAQTPLVWDEKPWPDGGRVVAFADGHVKYVNRQEWEGLIWPYEISRRATKPRPRASAAVRAGPA